MHGPIVVTVDGSPDNERVIPFAADLARLGEVELQLVQVHTLTAALRRGHADVCGGLLAYEEAHVRLKLLAGRAGVAKTRGVLLEGAVVPTLLQYIEQVRPAFVMMYASEPADLPRIFSGDLPESIVRTARSPVIVCSGHAFVRKPDLRLQRILVGLDGSSLSESVLPAVRELAADAEIFLLRVVPWRGPLAVNDSTPPALVLRDLTERRREAAAYLDEHARQLRDDGFRVTTLVREGARPAPIITQEALRCDADLLAVATHGRDGGARLAVGSCAAEVLRTAALPVLVVNPWPVRSADWLGEIELAVAEAR